jgi:hypothetical protein
MKITFTVGQVVLIVFAVLGVFWLFDWISGRTTMRPALASYPAPNVNVNINMPEPKRKELTAGEHVKGLAKIGFNKAVETVIWPLGLLR